MVAQAGGALGHHGGDLHEVLVQGGARHGSHLM